MKGIKGNFKFFDLDGLIIVSKLRLMIYYSDKEKIGFILLVYLTKIKSSNNHSVREMRESMLRINRELLEDIVSHPNAYYNGVEYHKKNRVVDLKFRRDKKHFIAKVKGSNHYDIEVNFNQQGEMGEATCTCPAYDRFWGYCKHIVAVLLSIKEIDERGGLYKKNGNQQIDSILEYFHNQQLNERISVKLQIYYEVERHSMDETVESYLTLKVGEERMYVVRNIKEFIENVYNVKPQYFGKQFTFEPEIHGFGEGDQRVLDLIYEIHENETLSDSSFLGKSGNTLFDGKRVQLGDQALKRFLNLIREEKLQTEDRVKVCILDREPQNILVYEGDLPVDFQLEKQGEETILKLNYQGDVIRLVADGEYFLTHHGICRVTEQQRSGFMPFYRTMVVNQTNKLVIPKEKEEQFISEIYPIMKAVGKVEISPELSKTIYSPPLKAEVYFDQVDQLVKAEIRWVYGNMTLRPFEESKKEAGQILLRDIKKEEEIIGFFERNQFKIKNKQIYLEEEAAIFQLIYKELDKLQKISEVYYSETFKGMELKSAASFRGGIQLNREEDLLEFQFDIDGIEDHELTDLMESLRKKKKYYRLKDGSFIPLEEERLIAIDELMKQLDLSGENIHGKVIEIPKFKGIFVDEFLKQRDLGFVKKNKAYRQFIEDIKEFEEVEYDEPQELKEILRNYQRLGFRWLKSLTRYGLGGILADDMGLGKTLQILTYLVDEKEKRGQGTALIVSPTSLVYNWIAEVEKFTPELRIKAIVGSKNEREEIMKEIDEYDIIITSYPLIRRDAELYETRSFRCCILDEAQHIKNPVSQNAKAVKAIRATHRFALTGTPIENSLTELWSIFDFVMPGYLLSHHKFKGRFEKPIVKDRDSEALASLGKLIRPFVLRRMKRDVLQELPEKIESKMVAELTEDQKKLYLAYLKQIKGQIQEEIEQNGFERSQMKILAGLTRLRQICCHPSLFVENYEGGSGKLDLLEEVVAASLEAGHRILLFSQFTSMLKMIREKLDQQGIEYAYLDGSTPMEARGEIVKEFNEGKGSIFLISLKAGGTGLNLTGADTVIHFDPWWNPAVEDQATDRAYRIGQKNKVHVMKFIAQGTIEEKIFKLQERKKEMINAVIQPGETFLAKMNSQELMELLK